MPRSAPYMRVLVASASAKSGFAAVESLVRHGKVNVRALVRNPDSDSGRRVQALGVEVVKGDFTDAASLDSALQGVQRAFLVGAAESRTHVQDECNFIDAAARAGVQLVVRVSAAGFLISEKTPVLWGRAHALIEAHIARTKAPVLDINSDWFLDNFAAGAAEAKAAGTVTLPVPGTGKTAPIDPRDIGRAAAAVLVLPDAHALRLLARGRLELHGPEVLSLDDLARAVSDAAGYQVRVVPEDGQAWSRRMQSYGLPAAVADSLVQTFRQAWGFAEPERPAQHQTDPELLAVYRPTLTARQWAEDNAEAWRRKVRVLVASGTAKTAVAAVKALLASRRAEVRALTRNPDSPAARELAALGAEVVRGDFNDAASLKAALKGVRRAFLVGTVGNQVAEESAFLAAAAEEGLEGTVRLACTTFLTGKELKSVLWAVSHAEVEEVVAAHKYRVVDLRPDYFFDNVLGSAGEVKAAGQLTLPLGADHPKKFGGIDPRDIGGAAAAILLSPPAKFAEFLAAGHTEVHGPEAIGFGDLVAAVSAAAGYPVRLNAVPPAEWVKALVGYGVPEALAHSYADTALVTGGVLPDLRPRVLETDALLSSVYRPQYSVRQWAQDHAAAWRRRPLVLVASASARTGNAAARELLAGGKADVRALFRKPESDAARELARLGAEVFKGDFDDAASLRAAVRGVQRVMLVNAAGQDSQFDQEKALVEAATAAGVEVVVRVSTYDTLIHPASSCVYGRAHGRMELFVRATGAKVVDLRPHWFFDNLLAGAAEAKAAGTFSVPSQKNDFKGVHIDPRDVGAAAAAVLSLPTAELAPFLEAGHVHVVGPELVTLQETAEELSKAAGYQVRLQPVPEEAYVQALVGAGMSEYFARSFKDTVLLAGDGVEYYRPLVNQSSPLILKIWKPKITLREWAATVGASVLRK